MAFISVLDNVTPSNAVLLCISSLVLNWFALAGGAGADWWNGQKIFTHVVN